MADQKSISILKETLPGEKRVCLLPTEVADFVDDGFDVFVEHDAGLRSGYDDHAYAAVGAKPVDTKTAWNSSKVVLKLFGLKEDEFDNLHEGKVYGGFLHAEGRKPLVDALLKTGATIYSYEYFKSANGTFPMAMPLSEISGQSAIHYAAYFLQDHLGGRGMLMSSVPHADPCRVLVIGYGSAGGAAARLAARMGAKVVVLGTNRERLRAFHASMPPGTECYLNSREVLEREVPQADVIIGAILISTFDTPGMVTEDLVRQMRPGSVIVDVTCGHGAGYMPTFDRFTTHKDPVYVKHDVVHCKIDILPASVPFTAVQATSPVIAPYLKAMATSIYDPTQPDPTSLAGKIIDAGEITHAEIQRNMDMIIAAQQSAAE